MGENKTLYIYTVFSLSPQKARFPLLYHGLFGLNSLCTSVKKASLAL